MEQDWTEIEDVALRKRIQNRLAQRKHRRKQQEQQQSMNVAQNAQNTVNTNNHPYFPPSFNPQTDPRLDSRAQVDYDLDEGGITDFGSGEYNPTGAGLVGQPWNLSSSSRGHGSSSGILPDLIGKQPEYWEGLQRTGHEKQHTKNPGGIGGNHHAGDEPITAGFGPSPVWTMAQPESSQWHQQQQQQQHQQQQQQRQHSHTPHPAGRSPEEYSSSAQKRQSVVSESDVRPGDGNHGCPECGFQKRQKEAIQPLVATYHTRQGIPSPAPTSPTQISGSDLLRDHGIDLARITAQANSGRRQSLSASSSSALCTHHQNHGPRQVVDVKRDGRNEKHPEQASPRVTKVVVIYMQDE
ncbi:hypothetical protein F5B21DRAFT_464813 [Xylaria acuta]|nr:hypothetical protein F5B21DRAFT_464813 [Xylaria acuta]